MLFNSFVFFYFLTVVAVGFRLLPTRRMRVSFLLAASYFFYGYWDWRFTGLLATSTLVDFAVGRKLARADAPHVRRRLLGVSLAVNLGILIVFKYLNFFADSTIALAHALGVELATWHVHLLLPVGVSFYTLKTLSHTIDVYRGRLAPSDSLLDYSLYVAFFPNLIAGPIDRARDILPQIATLSHATREQVSDGILLVAMGLLRKVLIGDAAGRIVDNMFGQPELYRSPELLAGWFLYGIQVYADFSGYSLIARGVAKLVGVELMKNFEQPYFARSLSEFWRRWHISLSSWIWDYVFNPIVNAFLRRVDRWHLSSVEAEMRLAYPSAAVLTMLLCGMWHGAGLSFVVWGAIHGIGLAVERLAVYGNRAIPLRPRVRGLRDVLGVATGVVGTQAVVLFAWLFFRAESVDAAWGYLGRIVRWESSDLSGRFFGIVLSFASVLIALDAAEYASRSQVFVLRWGRPVAAGVCAAIFVVVGLYMATTKPLPFVYFQF